MIAVFIQFSFSLGKTAKHAKRDVANNAGKP